MATEAQARAERRRLEQERSITAQNVRDENANVARIEREMVEKKRRMIELHVLLGRKPGGAKAECAEADELKQTVNDLAELQTEREQADAAQEGAARAKQGVEAELETCLYTHMDVFLGDQAEREEALGAKLSKLLPLYRDVERQWAEISAEYAQLGPALRDRLKDADNAAGRWPDPNVYVRATTPRPCPLFPSNQVLAAASPRPSGADALLERQRQKKAAA